MQQSQNKTMTLSFFQILTLFFFNSTPVLANCLFYPDIEKKISINDPNRLTCINSANFLLPIPQRKSVEEITLGPQLNTPTIKAGQTVYCRFVYKYQNGSSNKFRCFQTDDKNTLLNEDGLAVTEAADVQDLQIGTKLEEDVLVTTEGKPIFKKSKDGSLKPVHADLLKVRFKYSLSEENTLSELSEWRHREAFTSTVASRLAWLMGFPAEHYYPTQAVTCFGCDNDPWKDGLAPQTSLVEKTNTFPYASIEVKFDAKRIIKAFTSNPKLGKPFTNVPWTWYEYFLNFKKLNSKQQHEIQVLTLFISLIHTFEERGSQHVMVCEKAQISEDKKTCLQPLAATHDLGSAFGNRSSVFIKNGNHPRGNYESYKALSIFRDKECTLTAQPGRPADIKGDGLLKKVSEAARIEFLTRLDLVSKETLFTILNISNFQEVDLPFKNQVAKKMGLKDEALNKKVLEMWTDLIYDKMQQFKDVQCPSEPVFGN